MNDKTENPTLWLLRIQDLEATLEAASTKIKELEEALSAANIKLQRRTEALELLLACTTLPENPHITKMEYVARVSAYALQD